MKKIKFQHKPGVWRKKIDSRDLQGGTQNQKQFKLLTSVWDKLKTLTHGATATLDAILRATWKLPRGYVSSLKLVFTTCRTIFYVCNIALIHFGE